MRNICKALAGLVALVALIAPQTTLADTVGTAGAANVESSGTPPGGALRVIQIGTQVVRDEKIETSATGSVQLLFIDKTTLSIGRNSRIVIDKFVFNPATTAGELALSLSKGVFRIVGGQATHSGGATIRTPLASIGVRGGIATVSHSKAKGTQAILGYGEMTVTSLCGGAGAAANGCTPQTVTVRRPGFMVQVSGADAAPSAPVRVGAPELEATNIQLTSQRGQSGGAAIAPSDPLAASYNVGTPNSPTAPTYAATSNPRRGGAQAAAVALAVQQVAQQGVQNTASVTTSQMVSPSPPPPPPPPQPAPVSAFEILTEGPYSTSTGASSVPYLTANYVGAGTFTVSPIYSYAAGGLNADGTTDVTSRQFQAGLQVSGQGAGQTSTLFVMTSTITQAPNIGFTEGGGFSVVTYQPSRNYVGYHPSGSVASGTPTSSPNSVPTNAFGEPTGAYTLYDVNSNLNTGQLTNATSTDFPSGSYTFNPISTSAPSQATPSHPALNLQGYVAGLMQSAYINPINSSNSGSYSAPYIVTNATGNPGDVSIALPGGSSQMGAILNIKSVNAPSNGLATSSYQFGSYDASDPNNNAGRNEARGAYFDPADFGGRARTIFDNGANIPTSSRNGVTLSGSGDFADLLMVTATPVGANTSAFLTSISSTTVAPCACEYTQWGFWSALAGESLDNGQSRYVDSSSVPALWVAGVPTTAANIPTTGTATYTGHAIADISNNGAQYLAAGTFANTVNFATRSGAVTIGGLDGTNYAGAVTLTPSSTLFAGNLTGNVGGRVAALNGSFFQGGATNSTPLYGEMGGNLTISGTHYLGSGIFLGRKP